MNSAASGQRAGQRERFREGAGSIQLGARRSGDADPKSHVAQVFVGHEIDANVQAARGIEGGDLLTCLAQQAHLPNLQAWLSLSPWGGPKTRRGPGFGCRGLQAMRWREGRR